LIFSFLLLAQRLSHLQVWSASGTPVKCRKWCTPGMGVNLWGESPLYVNPVNIVNILTKILAEDKGIAVRRCLKEV